MTPDPVTVRRDLSVTEAAKLMVEQRIGALPVVEDDRLVGIVTEGDLIMQDVKIEFPTYIHLLDGFIMYPVSRLPVLDGEKVVGIISKSDIVRSIVSGA